MQEKHIAKGEAEKRKSEKQDSHVENRSSNKSTVKKLNPMICHLRVL